MSKYKLLNGSEVELSEKQETFVKRAVELFPDVKKSGVITRKQAFEVYLDCNVGHPKWLKNKKLHAERGSYYLPLEKVSDKADKKKPAKKAKAQKEEPAEMVDQGDDLTDAIAAAGLVEEENEKAA